MQHASLFSGIGGFDLAAEWMGWTNVFNCEWEEFPQRVLKHHFPNAKQFGDIKELDATAYAGRVDILTGGFPCQPYSLAGKRKGKDDERHLWPEMLRIIRECTPRYVVGENVRGLVGWNGGVVFEEVCADLEACGYAVQPFVLPACAVGAPHRRDRVWFVAYATGIRNTSPGKSGDVERQRREGVERAKKGRGRSERSDGSLGFSRVATHANDKGRSDGHGQVQGADGEIRQRDDRPEPCDASGRNASDTQVPRGERQRLEGPGQVQPYGRGGENMEAAWENFPTVPPVCGTNDGLPKELDGITFSKWRRESIKAYGNAIVPQVALQIFKAIEQYEREVLV
jgi:DNA (cytosine-5)-methyltransferase 1